MELSTCSQPEMKQIVYHGSPTSTLPYRNASLCHSTTRVVDTNTTLMLMFFCYTEYLCNCISNLFYISFIQLEDHICRLNTSVEVWSLLTSNVILFPFVYRTTPHSEAQWWWRHTPWSTVITSSTYWLYWTRCDRDWTFCKCCNQCSYNLFEKNWPLHFP